MTERGASARVADVLKSGLEHQLIADDEVHLVGEPLAQHSSTVKNNTFVPGARARDDVQVAADWDDEKYGKFAERLSELRDDASAL